VYNLQPVRIELQMDRERETSMLSIPQTEAISNFKNACADVLSKVRKGPVLLLQRSQAAAVLVDPVMWNQYVEEMRELRLMLLYYQRRDAAQKDPDLLVTHEELEQQLAEKAQTMRKLAA
jgi:hypothetical protein